MSKQIALEDNKVVYTLKKSRRTKRMRLSVDCNGTVVVTVPNGFKETIVDSFVQEKRNWIFSKLELFKEFNSNFNVRYTRKDYITYKEAALTLITERAEYFSNLYGYKYNRISIKDQRTRWGSCSKKSNLNFNYKILFLPKDIQDYIILHELCHLKEPNHSKQFWNLVSNILPNHKESRRELKQHSLIMR